MRGEVQDASGAVVSGAEIVLHSTDENTERAVNADAAGNFILENVKAGKYSLHAHHDGFADTVISGISLEARQDLRLTVALNIAEQSTTVQVTSDADQINTENATLDDSKSNLEMTQLPLNNRATTTSPLGALGLSPNVQTDSAGNIALGGASFFDGQLFGRWYLDCQCSAEWRIAGRLSLAGGDRRRQGDVIQQQRGVLSDRRRHIHDQERNESISRKRV